MKFFDKKLSRINLVCPLVLAAIVGLFYFAANILHGLLFIRYFSTGFILANLPNGF